MIFLPETVIGWQRAGFRMFWRWKPRRRRGRPGKDLELIRLIHRMWADLSAEPREWHRRHGFLCGSNRDGSSALSAGRHAS